MYKGLGLRHNAPRAGTLFDLWERRQAMLSGLTRIPVNPTHPASAVRLARLCPLLAREPARQVGAFITGFGDAMHEMPMN